MKILEVIDRVDALYPNAFSFEQKLQWCYELSCLLRSKVKRIYDSYLIPYEDAVPYYILPNEVLFEDIDSVFCDEVPLIKTDWRTNGIYPHFSEDGSISGVIFPPCRMVRMVVKTRPAPYRDYETVFRNAIFDSNKIQVENDGDIIFIPGDTLIISGSSIEANNKRAVLIDVNGNEMVFPRESFTTAAEAEDITVKRMIDDDTECPAPYDDMYIHYLLGKIHLYNNDLNSYNAMIAQYNARLEEYEQSFKETNPIKTCKAFNYF